MQSETTFRIRPTTEADSGLILGFIRELAEYEKMLDQVVATEEDIRESVFRKGQAECVLAEENGEPVGFALYFFSYSTFLGRANLYLEDVYVRPSCRGKGYGGALLAHLAAIAVERGCGRMEWACLNWNESSIAFYKGLGAVPMDEWTTYHLRSDALRALAEKQQG